MNNLPNLAKKQHYLYILKYAHVNPKRHLASPARVCTMHPAIQDTCKWK